LTELGESCEKNAEKQTSQGATGAELLGHGTDDKEACVRHRTGQSH
jgi:hypothetical protein